MWVYLRDSNTIIEISSCWVDENSLGTSLRFEDKHGQTLSWRYKVSDTAHAILRDLADAIKRGDTLFEI